MAASLPPFEPVAEMERQRNRGRRVNEQGELAREVSRIIHEWDADPTDERYLVAQCADSTEALRLYQTVQNVCLSKPCRDTNFIYDGHKRGNNVYIERVRKREYKWL